MSEASSQRGASPPSSDQAASEFSRPSYMTVGNGSTSEHAARLTALLDHDDSGYGGSIADSEATLANSVFAPAFHDTFTPKGSPLLSGTDVERRVMASHIHQLYYNQNKTALARAVTKTVDTLKRLQELNAKWPAHYPTVQRPDSNTSRPPLTQTASTYDSPSSPQHESPQRPTQLRRAETSINPSTTQAESSSQAASRPAPEPRLVTPQLAREFSILKIDLKMGHLSQAELVHSLEKSSISALLDGQINTTIRHLLSLRERIEDTASKVLITGDLNAGKSTFCNALLRRKVLPEDQQPCTSIFCEVLDVRENAGLEEVHAIPNGSTYNRNDERTYKVFGLECLEKIVTDNEKWSQCKIYIKDIRSVDESLLNNGVVDIALIDAPGLNHDSVITTANFAKQEEIDVVVFVVSAANHFTQSAKEFVFNAAREKAYIFMVVNGFDNIKDKERCQEMILKQVQHLSPATFKEADELVHFVASNDIPVAPPGFNPSGGSGSGTGGPDDEDDDDPSKKDKGKGKDKENARDFSELETSLRRFVLEKRARSKLAPAKTYLINLTSDLNNLATVNRDVAQSELDRVSQELKALEPELEKCKTATTKAGDGSDQTIEDTVTEVYDYTRESLTSTITNIADLDLGIEYPGFFNIYSYAEDLKHAMLDEIANTVSICEDHARTKSVSGVNAIKSLGLMHLGGAFPDFAYRPENMFKRRKDILTRQVDVDVEIFDFFDLSTLWERQEKVASTSMAVTVAGVVGTRLLGGFAWSDGAFMVVKSLGVSNVRRLIVPGIIASSKCLFSPFYMYTHSNLL
jgi:GTP-binding protein EngB required for normal cell division